jgi:hypothetical protein
LLKARPKRLFDGLAGFNHPLLWHTARGHLFTNFQFLIPSLNQFGYQVGHKNVVSEGLQMQHTRVMASEPSVAGTKK